jgi:hypothetical protein
MKARPVAGDQISDQAHFGKLSSMEQALPLVAVVLSSDLPNQFAKPTACTSPVAPEPVSFVQRMAAMASHSRVRTVVLL